LLPVTAASAASKGLRALHQARRLADAVTTSRSAPASLMTLSSGRPGPRATRRSSATGTSANPAPEPAEPPRAITKTEARLRRPGPYKLDRRPRRLCSITPSGGAGRPCGEESLTSSARRPTAGSPRTTAHSTSSSRTRLSSAETLRARSGLVSATAAEMLQPPSTGENDASNTPFPVQLRCRNATRFSTKTSYFSSMPRAW
jgi:hypothetical protein